MVLGCTTTHLGVCSGSKSPGEFASHVEFHVSLAHDQRLSVGVDGDEFDTADARFDHAVDGVHATTTNAHHLDYSKVIARASGHGILQPSGFT